MPTQEELESAISSPENVKAFATKLVTGPQYGDTGAGTSEGVNDGSAAAKD